MGTLTANQDRLPDYCDHKLPTSCRLSSIPECCACADERAHAPSYSVYIDGIGFVPRGTRWQRYCWFCKEFWENRVFMSGLRPTQTRIPDVPDQSAFLRRWYEFHQGFRIVHKDDGSEERVAVLGEDLGQVSPGHLPRTLEEMRSGQERSQLDAPARPEAPETEQEGDAGPSLDEAFDQMLGEAAAEEDLAGRAPSLTVITEDEAVTGQIVRSSGARSQVMNPIGSRSHEYQVRRVAALRRELQRMRSGIERVISGLRDLGETVPNYGQAVGPLTELGSTLDVIAGTSAPSEPQITQLGETAEPRTTRPATETDRSVAGMQSRVDLARRHFNEARRVRDQAATELDLAEREFSTSQHRLQQLQRDQRTMENYIRLFGTREEMAAQGDSYESPIGAMFTRAYERFRSAEEDRREQRALLQRLADEAASNSRYEMHRLATLNAMPRDDMGLPRLTGGIGSDDVGTPQGDEIALQEYYALIRRQEREGRPGADSTSSQQELLRSLARPSDDAVGASQSVEALYRQDAEAMIQWYNENDENDNEIKLRLEQVLSRATLQDMDRAEIDTAVIAEAAGFLAGISTTRVARRRQAGELVTLSNAAHIDGQLDTMELELMAEAYQMSLEVRRYGAEQAISSDMERDMLRRLPTRQRTREDFGRIKALFENASAREAAIRVHNEQMRGSSRATSQLQAQLEQARRDAARSGDHSRDELDAQRRATQAFAVAAGRMAMQTGPAALLERMASRDEATRAAYERLQENGFVPEESNTSQPLTFRTLSLADFAAPTASSESESEEEDEAQGLDARDTGRPEPKEEDEMTFRLDCRICYTQVADVACLPCGHLVMCKWCSDVHSPVMAHDRTRPRRPAGCPVCRKGIRQKVRVYRPS